MKILVVGSGGREHALVWKCAQSGGKHEIYAAPGNPGMARYATCVDIGAGDISGLTRFAVAEKMDLVVVGPEVPLCLGIADILEDAGIPVFGPSYAAARLEGSKVFSKSIMEKYGVPTAAFASFESHTEAIAYAENLQADMWIKASGLAAGKGAVYAENDTVARDIITRMMVDGEFGESGSSIVIEENMTGEEASIFAICDGETYKVLVSSQDHKRAYDNDEGPNTGGMGAYAPAPLVTPELLKTVEETILRPTLDGMAREGSPYKGLLYAGIMATPDGPKVVEYNCRFGDPETQVVLPLLDGDLVEIMMAAARGRLSGVPVDSMAGSALCVVMASGGYPGSYEKGRVISGLDDAGALDGVTVFHAGTKQNDNDIVTAGGRVLGVTGYGKDFAEARKRSYDAVARISFKDAFHRTDIGARALKHFS